MTNTNHNAMGDTSVLLEFNQHFTGFIPVDFSLTVEGALKDLSDQLTEDILIPHYCEVSRKPTPSKIEQLKQNSGVILANLFLQYSSQQVEGINSRAECLAIDRRPSRYPAKTCRYHINGVSYDYLIKRVVDPLMEQGLIVQHLGFKPKDPKKKSYKTRIKPSEWLELQFAEIYKAYQLDKKSRYLVGRNKEAEVILLKNSDKKLINYPETPLTAAMRERLQTYNGFIETGPEITLRGHRKVEKLSLCRIFNNSSFDQGGRFYKGFWQFIKSKDRKELRIDGEPIVELDYSSLHLSALYNMKLGVDVPAGDLYELSDYLKSKPGDPVIRKATKLVAIIVCNTRTKKQAEFAVDKKLNEMRNKGASIPWDGKELINAFMRKHRALREFFCTEQGMELQRMDSEIVDKILALSVERNIPVLPIHDSFIVKASDQHKLRDMMVSEYQAVTGFYPVLHAA